MMPRSFFQRRLGFALVLALLLISQVQVTAQTGSAPVITADLGSALQTDRNNNGLIDPDDVVRYSLNLINCGTGDAQGVGFNANLDPNSRLVPGSIAVGAPRPANCPGQPVPPAPPPPSTGVAVVVTPTPTASSTGTLTVTPTPTASSTGTLTATPTPTPTATLLIGAPVAVGDAYTTPFNAALSVPVPGVLGNDTLNGATLAPLVNAPTTAGGTVTLNAGGDFLYTPPLNFSGPDTFNYVLSNSVSSTSATVTITVDALPRVISTSPINSEVGVDPLASIVLTFSEPVNIATTQPPFTLVCNTLPQNFTFSGSGTDLITLDPVSALPLAAVCTVTLNAAMITGVDRPEQLDGDNDNVPGGPFSFNFRVTEPTNTPTPSISPTPSNTPTNTPLPPVDDAPVLISTEVESGDVFVNAAGRTEVDVDTVIRLTFSEPVTTTPASFGLECPSGLPITFTVLGSGSTVITLTPGAALPLATVCVFNIDATQITDTDLIDPPDNLAPFTPITFTTGTDDPPGVTDVEVEVSGTFTSLPMLPGNFADEDSNLRVTFTEPVTPNGNWAELNCTSSGFASIDDGLLSVVVAANPVFQLARLTAFSPNETCTLTIIGAAISDDDVLDPPDSDFNNVVLSFTVADTAPQVSRIIPSNNGVGASNQAVTIEFSEPVNIAAGAIDWRCPSTSLPISFTPVLPQTNVTTITLTPGQLLGNNVTCTVTLESTLITDVDTNGGLNELDGDFNRDVNNGDPDDFISTFTTDASPGVVSVFLRDDGLPAELPPFLGQRFDRDTVFDITFNQLVDIPAGGIILECNSNPISFTPLLPQTNLTTITLTPDTDLPADATCQLFFNAAGPTAIVDSDLIDPPDAFGSGTSLGFMFTTDNAPTAAADAYTITPHLTFTAPSSVRANDAPTTATVTGFGPTAGTATTPPNGTNFITAGGAGGRVIMNADGTFSYYPDAGDTSASGTATFFYTLTGGSTAQVTLTFNSSELVWFADFGGGCVVGTGTNVGTQACPATGLTGIGSPASVHTTNDIIFIDSGNYQCGVTLLNGAWVIGNGTTGSTLSSLIASRVTIVPGSDLAPYDALNGTAPVLSSSAANCFTLGQNNTVRGLTIANTDTFAGIVGTNYGTLTISDVTDNGTGQTLVLDTGTVNAALLGLTSTSSDATAAPLSIRSSVATVTVAGDVTIANVAAGVSAIELVSNTGSFSFNTSGGTATTTVNRSTSGRAVVLGDGTAQSATVTFNRLAIANGGGTALETNRQTGTVTVSSATGSNLSATNGAAINIINVAGNTTPLALALNTVSASSSASGTPCFTGHAPAGVCLSGATGTVGLASLSVTTGTNHHGIMAANGGTAAVTIGTATITGTTVSIPETTLATGIPSSVGSGDAMLLNNFNGSLTINGGSLESCGEQCVDTRASGSLTLTNVSINTAARQGIRIYNPDTGSTTTLTRVQIDGMPIAGTGVDVLKDTITSATVTLTDPRIATSSTFDYGVQVLGYGGTGTLTVNVDGTNDPRTQLTGSACQLNQLRNHGIFGSAGLVSSDSTTINLNVTDCYFNPGSAGRGGGIRSEAYTTTTHRPRIERNYFTNHAINLPSGIGAVSVITGSGTSTATLGNGLVGGAARINDNVIEGIATEGVLIISQGNALGTQIEVARNTIRNTGGRGGIVVTVTDNAANTDVSITNNTVTIPFSTLSTVQEGIHVTMFGSGSSSVTNHRVRVSDNTATSNNSGIPAIAIRVQGANRFVDATVQGNTATAAASGQDAYLFITSNGLGGTPDLCLNASSNTTANGNYRLTQGAGTFTISQSSTAAFQAANTGTFTFNGIANFNGICATPIVSAPTDTLIAGVSAPPLAALPADPIAALLALDARPVNAQAAALTIPVGTIPAGQQVTVTFDVTVSRDLPRTVTALTLQGTVTGSNFAPVRTNDPATLAAGDATVTALNPLHSARTLPATGETAPLNVGVVIAGLAALFAALGAVLVLVRSRWSRG